MRQSYLYNKTVDWPSCLYNGNSYTEKTAFLHWNGSSSYTLEIRRDDYTDYTLYIAYIMGK